MKRVKTLTPNDEKRIKRNYARVKSIIEHGQLAFRSGDLTGGMRRSMSGFRLARQNADLLRDTYAEPIRSHMHFIAAALAMDLKKYDQVLDMVARAQEGNPPAGIAKELARMRQAAMQAKLQSSGEGVSDTDGTELGKRLKETAQGDNESGPESGHEPGDSAAREPESEHGEQVRPSDLHG